VASPYNYSISKCFCFCQALIVNLLSFYITFYFILLRVTIFFLGLFILITIHLSRIVLCTLSPLVIGHAHIQNNWSNITSSFNVVCNLSDTCLDLKIFASLQYQLFAAIVLILISSRSLFFFIVKSRHLRL